MTHIEISPLELRPLVQSVVCEVLAEMRDQDARMGTRLAFPEPEAASLLGLRPHVLRDARLRGEIQAARIGRRVIYDVKDLKKFLRQKRK